MIPRNAEHTLRQLAGGYPAVAVTGPRQSGKTTLARHVFSDKPYVSFENPDVRERAQSDFRGFLENYRRGAVFDEAQRCPELFSYLQQILDEDSTPGRFILTGSQQFGLRSGITQSLAGRVALVELLPFTLHECYGWKKPAKLNLATVLFNGLYPPVHDRKLDPHIWYANYMQSYIERDVRQMVNIRDLSSFQRFVRLCAGRNAQMMNLSDLASDCGITHNTAKAWISILEASYIVYMLQPHYENFNKRIIKTPKLYFYDTGLAAWLLGVQTPDQLGTHPLRGALFESFVVSEFVKARFNSGLRSNLFFWRDRSGNEIDLIVETGEHLQPIEIKSGQTIAGDFLSGLKKWITLSNGRAASPALIYGGREGAVQSGIRIIPWTEIGGTDAMSGVLQGNPPTP
ncbi:MAG: ATP-binding protein [Deltaproteobacteria bacterium]|nr:ATP-binding protein [Deltaproteobacteria bacterium]